MLIQPGEKILIWVWQYLVSLTAVKSGAVSTIIWLFSSSQKIHTCASSPSTFSETQEPALLISRSNTCKWYCLVWFDISQTLAGVFSQTCECLSWWCPGVFRPWESSGREEGVLSKSMETTATRRSPLHNHHYHPNHQLAHVHRQGYKVICTSTEVGVKSKSMETKVDLKKVPVFTFDHNDCPSNHHQHIVLDGFGQHQPILPKMMITRVMTQCPCLILVFIIIRCPSLISIYYHQYFIID